MKAFVYSAVSALLLFGLLQVASAAATEQPPFDSCLGFLSLKKIREHNWIPFGTGKILFVDLAARMVAVDVKGKHYAIFVAHDTELCCEGKPGTMKQMEAGDPIRGVTKVVSGQSVAVALGYGKPLPYAIGIPLNGAPGYVYSPYAPGKLAFKVGNVAPGTLVKCPYTGKMFVMPPVPLRWTHHFTPD
jgi:hypothetical protein